MALIEVKYFNTFLLRKSVEIDPSSGVVTSPVWGGSRGIPQAVGGWEQGDIATSTQLGDSSTVPSDPDINWAIEESRIRGGYNNTTVSFGAKAYLVEDEPQGSIRGNAMIYSGIFNSTTGINNTNQFSVAETITKAVDPINGSIQKLYAENTNLIIFQERKVSKALIDKDAIYTAEGGGLPVSQLNLVIGQIVPYAGNFGISKNPESFAVYGYRKYFVDKDRNAVLRLSRDGITEISNYGMIDYFRDQLSLIDIPTFGLGKIVGGWDMYTKQYTLSLQTSNYNSNPDYQTLQFDERVLGWPSKYTFKPRWMFSLGGRFFSIQDTSRFPLPASTSDKVYIHNDNTVNRAEFYGLLSDSSITFVSNPDVMYSKVFKTISYEGSSGWEIDFFVSDITGVDSVELDGQGDPIWLVPPKLRDQTNQIQSYYEGEYIIDPIQANPTFNQPVYRPQYVSVFGTDDPPYNRQYGGFVRKENIYYANLVNSGQDIQPGQVRFGQDMTGIKALYCTIRIKTDNSTNVGGMKELFAVNTTFVKSS